MIKFLVHVAYRTVYGIWYWHPRHTWHSIRNRTTAWGALFLFYLQYLRLSIERVLTSRRPRIAAFACSIFPIYSQTFVYQETVQLLRRGFNLRFFYAQGDPTVVLPDQFTALRRTSRRVLFHPAVCRRSQAYFQQRMPEKVRRLMQTLAEHAKLPIDEIREHHHILQAFAFTRLIAAYRPQYMHSYFFYEGSLFCLIAAFLLDIPRGVSCYADHMMKDYALKVTRLHLEQCRLVIATSRRIMQELMDIAPRLDETHILVKPNAINTAVYPQAARTEPIDGASFRMICVSRLDPKKGHIYLIEAMALLQNRGVDIILHIIGDADDNEQGAVYLRGLKDRIGKLHLEDRVVLEGRCSEAEIKRWYVRSHLFAAPFIETADGNKDGIPTALLEAMSTGLPAVATDAGSIAEVIEHDCNGLLVPQKNPDALAESIINLINDADKRDRLGRNAASKIRTRFDINVCEPRFHHRVTEIVNRKPPGGPNERHPASDLLDEKL